ncbi:MAG: hypothetical protein JWP44_4430, partial [Mucilaginibacter sp.]|nr:hypothetical protein [Mucilaginibacter sp.]
SLLSLPLPSLPLTASCQLGKALKNLLTE